MSAASLSALERRVQGAERHLAAGRYRAAFDGFTDALVERTRALVDEGASAVTADLQVIYRIARLAVLYGKHDAADDLFHAYEALSREAGNRVAADYAAVIRAQLAASVGKFDVAEAALESAGARCPQLDHEQISTALSTWEARLDWNTLPSGSRRALLASIYLVNGQLLAGAGRYAAADLLFARGVELGDGTSDMSQSVNLHLGLALAASHLERGGLGEAVARLREVDASIDAGRNPGLRVQWHECMAKYALLTGMLGDALRHSDAVLEICRKGEFDNAGAIAVLNRASVKILINRTLEAATDAREVETWAMKRGDAELAARARMQLMLAQARSSATELGSSIAPSVSSMWGDDPGLSPGAAPEAAVDLGRQPRSTSYLAHFEDRALAYQCSLANRDLVSANRQCDLIDRDFQDTDSALIRVRRDVLRGMLQYYQGNLVAASQTLVRAHANLAAMGLKPEAWQAARFLGWCFARSNASTKQARRWEAEAESLLEELTNSLTNADQAHYLLNKWTAEEEGIAGRLDELVIRRRQCNAAAWYRRPLERLRLAWETDRFLEQLTLHKVKFARAILRSSADAAASSTSFADFLGRLVSFPRSRARVSFVVLPDRTAVFQRGFVSLKFGICRVSRIELRDRIRTWHQGLQASLDSAPETGDSAAAAALDMLVDRLQIGDLLAHLPPSVRALEIEPDDILHGLPFGVLPCNGGVILEKYAVSVAPAIGTPVRRHARKPLETAMLAAVSQGDAVFPELPGANHELDRVAAALDSLRLRVRRIPNDASKAEVMRSLPECSLTHIACHGRFRGDSPGESALMLAGPTRSLEPVTLGELVALDLSNVGHITLSSCWSADNFIWPGRWIVSLPHALCLAGVGSVLGCLWEVEDDAAVQFMATFYQNLAACPPEDALRRTQLTWRTKAHAGHPEWHHPWYWAGFIVHGNESQALTQPLRRDRCYTRPGLESAWEAAGRSRYQRSGALAKRPFWQWQCLRGRDVERACVSPRRIGRSPS